MYEIPRMVLVQADSRIYKVHNATRTPRQAFPFGPGLLFIHYFLPT